VQQGLIHRLTHTHYTVNKPGVGDIVLATRRLLPRLDLYVRPDGDEGWTRLVGVEQADFEQLAGAEDGPALRRMLTDLAK
jgi:hypothetical protein